MREIKFRARDKIHDKIVSWDLIIKYCDRFSLMADKNYEFMQYTGLKDKNDKEIYEGDIIERLKTGGYGSHLVGEVIVDGFKISGDILDRKYEVLHGFDGWLYLKDLNINRFGFLRFKDITTFEIIGNIYSNSELLK